MKTITKGLILLLLISASLLAESEWTYSVTVYISLQGGGYPDGADHLCTDYPDDDPMSWRQRGLSFMTWMSDVSTGEVSDTFWAGDVAYNHSYFVPPGVGYGLYVFNLDAFKTVGREYPMEVELGDTLHIRLLHVSTGGDTFICSLDTVFVEEPPINPIEIELLMMNNYTPAPPTLATPSDDAKLASPPASLIWNIPADPEGDDLHFRVELDSDGSFASSDYSWESWVDATDFTDAMPIASGSGQTGVNIPEISYGTWSWRVTSYDGTSESLPSEVRTFSINTPPAAATIVSPIDGAILASSPETVEWNIPSDVDGDELHFVLQLDGDGDFGTCDYEYDSRVSTDGFSAALPALSGTGTCFFDIPALPSGQWYWRVRANDGTDFNTSSPSWTFNVDTPPEAPVLESPLDMFQNADSPTELRWTVPEDFDGDDLDFRVEIDRDGDFSPYPDYSYESWESPDGFSSVPAPEGTGTCSFTVPALPEGQWSWRVTAFDGLREGPVSSEWTFIHNTPPASAVPIFPADEEKLDEFSSMEWTVPVDVDGDSLGFHVQISQDSLFSSDVNDYYSSVSTTGFSPVPPVAEGTGSCSLDPTDEYGPGSYFWHVRAYDGYEYGEYGATNAFTVNSPPDIATIVSPAPESNLSDPPSSFTWNVPTDENGDDLYFRIEVDSDGDFSTCDFTYESWVDDANFSPAQPQAEGTGICTFDVPPASMELTTGHWYWRVTARDGSLTGDPTSASHFSIASTPSAPTLLSPADGEVLNDVPDIFIWEVPPDEDGDSLFFRIDIDAEGDFLSVDHQYSSWLDDTDFWPLQPVVEGTGTATYTPSELVLAPGTWHWRVYAWDGRDYSPVSGTRSFTINTGPEVPVPSSPSNGVVIANQPDELEWLNPIDLEGDELHFIVELDFDGSFDVVDHAFDSRSDATPFASVPATEGVGYTSVDLSSVSLSDGVWHWRVKAWDGTAFSDYSSVRTFRINTAPETPVLDNPPDGTELADMPAEFVWQIPTDTDGDALWFLIELDRDGDFGVVDFSYSSDETGAPFTPIPPVSEGVGLSYFDPPDGEDFAAGQWYWRVTAYDGTEFSSPSLVREFSINAPPSPPVLTSPSSDAVLGGAPSKLWWNVPADAEGDNLTFLVQIDRDGDFSSCDMSFPFATSSERFTPSEAVAAGSGSVSFTVYPEDSLDDGHFFWRVFAEDAFNTSLPSPAWHFDVDNTPAVSVIEYPADSSVFPDLDPIRIYGRATYPVGDVDSIYLTTDGGTSWQAYPATPEDRRSTWYVDFTPPAEGTYSIVSKAVCSAEAEIESKVERGRNKIDLIVDFARSGPNIDINPGTLVYDYTHGTGGGFARAAHTQDIHSPYHDIEVSHDYVEITFTWPRPHLYPDKEGIYRMEIKDLKSFGRPGEPELPLDVVKVMLPQGKMLGQAYVVNEEKIELPGTYNIAPGNTPTALSSRVPQPRIKDEEIYTSSSVFPEGPVTSSETGFSNGYSIGVINVVPAGYIPYEGKVFYYREMRVRFPLQNAPEIVESNGSFADRQKAMALVENPEFAYSYSFQQNSHLRGLESDMQYVIICPEAFSFDFQPLVDWKNGRGVTAGIVTIEEIQASYSGVDIAEKIRNYLIYAYTSLGTRYALLGGDSEFIPPRGVVSRISYIYYDVALPTDMYYACLDGNYNNDGDGSWGETNDGPMGGDIDWFSEISIGRCPADNTLEVQNFVNKTIAYEQSPMDSYMGEIVMAGEYLWTAPCGDSWGATSLELVEPYFPSEWNISTYYERDGSYANGSVLRSKWSTGTHIVNHLGHAQYWTDMKQTIADVNALSNTDYFMVYSQGCYANAFDDATSGSTGAISEAFVGGSSGAFAFIGNTRYGWGYPCNANGPSNKFHRAFMDAVFNGDVRNLGDANQRSKEANAGLLGFHGAHRWAAHGLCLMGDPETPIATQGGSRVITVENTGDENLMVAGIQNDNVTITAFPSTFTLAPGETQDLTVSVVSGVYPEGHYRDTLIIRTNDPDEPEKKLAIELYIYGTPYRTGSIPPNATIVTMSTNTATQGEGTVIDFAGEGNDPDGYVTNFEWIGALPETLSGMDSHTSVFTSTNPSFAINADSLEEGYYSVAFSVRDNDGNWSAPQMDSLQIVPSLVIGEDGADRPEELSLLDLYPNPFNSTVAVKYTLEEAGNVELSVLDMNGREMERLVDRYQAVGSYSIGWEATRETSSGIYLIRLTSSGRTISESAILIK